MKLWYLLTLLLCANSLYAEEMYRWVDADGNMQYTQTPPPAGINAEVKEIKGPSSAAAEGRSQAKSEEKTDETAATEDKDDAEKMMAEKNANCQKSMQDLQVLESKSEVVTLDSDNPSKAVSMDEKTRKQRIATEKAYIKTYCDGVKAAAPKSEVPKPADPTAPKK
jgi:Domain of unknown function (DUF4124)